MPKIKLTILQPEYGRFARGADAPQIIDPQNPGKNGDVAYALATQQLNEMTSQMRETNARIEAEKKRVFEESTLARLVGDYTTSMTVQESALQGNVTLQDETPDDVTGYADVTQPKGIPYKQYMDKWQELSNKTQESVLGGITDPIMKEKAKSRLIPLVVTGFGQAQGFTDKMEMRSREADLDRNLDRIQQSAKLAPTLEDAVKQVQFGEQLVNLAGAAINPATAQTKAAAHRKAALEGWADNQALADPLGFEKRAENKADPMYSLIDSNHIAKAVAHGVSVEKAKYELQKERFKAASDEHEKGITLMAIQGKRLTDQELEAFRPKLTPEAFKGAFAERKALDEAIQKSNPQRRDQIAIDITMGVIKNKLDLVKAADGYLDAGDFRAALGQLHAQLQDGKEGETEAKQNLKDDLHEAKTRARDFVAGRFPSGSDADRKDAPWGQDNMMVMIRAEALAALDGQIMGANGRKLGPKGIMDAANEVASRFSNVNHPSIQKWYSDNKFEHLLNYKSPIELSNALAHGKITDAEYSMQRRMLEQFMKWEQTKLPKTPQRDNPNPQR